MPATNMWWPQVRKPTNAIPSDAITSSRYEIGGLWHIVHTTSVITPIAGRIMM
jgi:hypothetical protein